MAASANFFGHCTIERRSVNADEIQVLFCLSGMATFSIAA